MGYELWVMSYGLWIMGLVHVLKYFDLVVRMILLRILIIELHSLFSPVNCSTVINPESFKRLSQYKVSLASLSAIPSL